jgi:predicted AAA+ superfamily ATPase
MTQYRPRVADKILQEKLDITSAVLIEGAKYCGKTTLGLHQAKSVLDMADPEKREQYLLLSRTNIKRLLAGEAPRLIDEWQIAPQLWDAIRHEVDVRGEEGQFILTGSAVPVNSDEIFHTGTGRVSWLKLRTMSLWESGESSGQISLSKLFKMNNFVDGENKVQSIEQLAYITCRGGWPRAVLAKSETAALGHAREYFEAVTRFDISRVDDITRNEDLTRRIMRSYARHQGAQASAGTILADIQANEQTTISENTIYSYIKALKKIFVIEDSTAWNPNLRSKTAIRTADTRYYTDPSIATAALGIGPEDLINDLNTFGLLFETLCVRDLRVYAEALNGTVYHYRDKNGLECDAVILLPNGSYGLIEIKLGGKELINEGAATLLKLAAKIDTDKMKKPAFMMVIVGVGDYAYEREDGVKVVPIGCLKD